MSGKDSGRGVHGGTGSAMDVETPPAALAPSDIGAPSTDAYAESMRLKRELQADMPFSWEKVRCALQKLMDERDQAQRNFEAARNAWHRAGDARNELSDRLTYLKLALHRMADAEEQSYRAGGQGRIETATALRELIGEFGHPTPDPEARRK